MQSCSRLLVACLLFLAACSSSLADTPAPLFFYASQSGKVTFDEAEGGGNPFASAFIEVLRQRDLGLADFASRLKSLTADKSGGRQLPDNPPLVTGTAKLVLNPAKPVAGKRAALVIVQSSYVPASGAPSLPGAARDAKRVGAALTEAGFETEIVLDADRGGFPQALANFAARSRDADLAVIYTTGHGVEYAGRVHLLLGDFPVAKGKSALSAHAIELRVIAAAARARWANLVFYAGCREDPFGR